jgi:hypothetical protein
MLSEDPQLKGERSAALGKAVCRCVELTGVVSPDFGE